MSICNGLNLLHNDRNPSCLGVGSNPFLPDQKLRVEVEGASPPLFSSVVVAAKLLFSLTSFAACSPSFFDPAQGFHTTVCFFFCSTFWKPSSVASFILLGGTIDGFVGQPSLLCLNTLHFWHLFGKCSYDMSMGIVSLLGTFIHMVSGGCSSASNSTRTLASPSKVVSFVCSSIRITHLTPLATMPIAFLNQTLPIEGILIHTGTEDSWSFVISSPCFQLFATTNCPSYQRGPMLRTLLRSSGLENRIKKQLLTFEKRSKCPLGFHTLSI